MVVHTVERVEILRDLDADELVAAGRLDLHADKLPAAGRPLEFLVDLALDDILVAAQAVAVFEQLVHAELGDVAEGRGFFPDEGFAGDHRDDDGGDGADDDSGMQM